MLAHLRRCAVLSLILLPALLAPRALAQEPKRPERMESALRPGGTTPDADTPANQPAGARIVWPGLQPDGLITLHSQWSLSPAGSHIALGDFPVNMALRPSDGEKPPIAAIIHCGQGTHEVITVNLTTKATVARVQIPQGFQGIAFSSDGKRVFASGGEFDIVHAWNVDADGLLSNHAEIRVVPQKDPFVVTGLTPSFAGDALYVCGSFGAKLAIVPTSGEGQTRLIDLPKDSYPYAPLLSRDGKHLFVSLWGASGVAVIDLASATVQSTWSTPSHPTEMVQNSDGSTLYVACSNSNYVASLDTETGQTLELINTALYPSASNGSTPTSLALSADGKTLLIANAENNNLAVIDVSDRGKADPRGFIPVGWYPTCVRFDAAGNLLVLSGKGLSPKTNRHGPMPGIAARNLREYIGSLHAGSLSFIAMPDDDALQRHTRRAYQCSPLLDNDTPRTATRPADSPIPARVGEKSPITHCIYIIKENRTYDQVLGDMKEGNGDASICLFGENITPNQHALCREFVLLDNFYVNSEVSADGHEWSMAAYATDFVEKLWPLNYRSQPKEREINYPSEGAYDIAIPAGGYIWDRCKQAGVSYLSMGEWVTNGKTPDDPCTPRVPALEGHIDPMFRSYDTDYSDILRAERFKANLAGWEKAGDMPRFMIVRLPNDHTAGTSRNKLTPAAYLAQNDQAVGMVVEAVSKSSFWKHTAIFIVEDDAQNGSDHVDAHRSTCYVASPYTRRRVVDSTMYSTSSVLRTMELILGLKPMSQFDAAAMPMWNAFTGTPDFTPYALKPARTDLEAKNLAGAFGQDDSERMNLAVEDAADDLELNRIIWHAVKGARVPMPPPVRAAFVRSAKPHADDDDER